MTRRPDSAPKGPRPTIGAANDPTGPSIWAFGGGKGGVGKSCVAVNVASVLARGGTKVTIVDADLGGANLDTMLGCERPPLTLGDFFSRRVAKLSDVSQQTPIEGLSLIAGDSETLGSANPHHAQKLKLIRHLRTLPASVVILDLGAGSNFNTLDLYLASDVGVVVTVPEPTAIQNCFTFLKSVTLRDLEQRTGTKRRERIEGSLRAHVGQEGNDARGALQRMTRLVVNRARPSEGRRVHEMLSRLVQRFLGGNLRLAGVVRDDKAVAESVKRMSPVVHLSPQSEVVTDFVDLSAQLTGEVRARGPSMGLNETIDLSDRSVHLQTEDLGDTQGAVRTQIFFTDGSVAYSRRTAYADPFFLRLKLSPADRPKFHHAAIKRALEQGRIRLAERRSA